MTGNENAQLVVLTGPAGVGKSTVVNRLRAEVPGLYFSVSMTTRAARPGEVDGRDYFFVTPQQFQERIDAGEMLEWADIHGGLQRSGTPRGPVEDALAQGRPVLIEVDLAGARSIRKVAPNAHLLFLAPPSWEILVSRLTGRGTETEAEVKRRLETARVEMEAQHEFDQIVVNDSIDEAVAAISEALTSDSRAD